MSMPRSNFSSQILFVFNELNICACKRKECQRLCPPGKIFIHGHHTVINNPGKNKSDITRERMSLAQTKRVLRGEGIGSRTKGVPKTEDQKRKISKKLKGRTYEDIHGEEKAKRLREKRRIDAIKHLERQNINLRFEGKYEKEILDEIERIKNIKIERSYMIIGYVLDGYCKELNMVYEVDEYNHIYQIEKDRKRQEEIEKELNCKFIRINVSEWLKQKYKGLVI